LYFFVVWLQIFELAGYVNSHFFFYSMMQPKIDPGALTELRQEARAWAAELGYTVTTRRGNPGKGTAVETAESCRDGSIAALRSSILLHEAHEAATLAKLAQHQHSNVLPTYAVRIFGAQLVAMITPQAQGSLSSYLGKRAIEACQGRIFAKDACAGLAHLHSCKILHRDVQPGNMLMFAGPTTHLKLADFGSACLCPDPQQVKPPFAAVPQLQPNIWKVIFCDLLP
jgi:serine/threonine protein kinase